MSIPSRFAVSVAGAVVAIGCMSCAAPTMPTQDAVYTKLAADAQLKTTLEHTLGLDEAEYRAYLACTAQAIVQTSTSAQAQDFLNGRRRWDQVPHVLPHAE